MGSKNPVIREDLVTPETHEIEDKDFNNEEIKEWVLSGVKEYFNENDSGAWGAPSEQFIENNFFDFSYLDGYTTKERYWVNKPFEYVSILRDEQAKQDVYYVGEPVLDEVERYVKQDLTKVLRDVLLYEDIDETTDKKQRFREKASEVVLKYGGDLPPGSLHKIQHYLEREFVNYGRMDPIMRDRHIEDVSCDGVDVPVYVYHTGYRDLETNLRFKDEEELNSYIIKLAQRCGKHITVSSPLVDTTAPDGSRVQLTLGKDISTRGSNFTIRKFAEVPITPIDLIRWNTFSVEQMAYFWLAIANNKSLIFAGGTASGKTTSMNAVSFFIPPESKTISIEDTREITLPHDNWVQSVTRKPFSEQDRGEVDMYDLLQAALRQRPEYLLVGEIRSQQDVALTFFQAMSTGHTSYTTFHADSIDSLFNRLQSEPLNVPRRMVESVDIVSIQKQIYMGDKRLRRTGEVYEVPEEQPGDRIETNKLFEWDPETDTHDREGEPTILERIRKDHGWDHEKLESELERRSRVLQYMADNEVTDYRRVADVIQMYWKDQDYVMQLVEHESLEEAEL